MRKGKARPAGLKNQEYVMTVDEARTLILFEGYPPPDFDDQSQFSGLWYESRNEPEFPTRERMYQILRALKVVFDSVKGADALDRTLCRALWNLGSFVPSMYLQVPSRHPLRDGLQQELHELEARVGSIFEGVWSECVRLPGLESNDRSA